MHRKVIDINIRSDRICVDRCTPVTYMCRPFDYEKTLLAILNALIIALTAFLICSYASHCNVVVPDIPERNSANVLLDRINAYIQISRQFNGGIRSFAHRSLHELITVLSPIAYA